MFPNSLLPNFHEWPVVRTFPNDVDDKEKITEQHEDLHERLEQLLDSKAIDDVEEEDIKHITEFLSHWDFLYDDRTNKDKIADAIDNMCNMQGWGGPHPDIERMHYYPEEYGKKLPKTGGWIIIIEDVPVNAAHRPEKFGVYFAIDKSKPKELKIENIKKPVQLKYYMVEVNINGEPVSLNPHEYALVTDMQDVLDSVGTEREMIRLGGDANYDSPKVHYLGTRGIPKSDVYNMLLGNVNSTKFAWFRLYPQYHEMYQHYIDCYAKGITQAMADRIWHCKQTGEPLFKVNYSINGKEVTEDEFKAHKSKDRKEDNPEGHQDDSEAGADVRPAGEER